MGAARFCRRLAVHARAHVIAYLALGCSLLALSGASYAALSLPTGSVGAAQIRNHVITPVKFSPRGIGGSVRHWALVSGATKVIDSSSRATAVRGGNVVKIDWHDEFSRRCIALATIHGVADVSIGAVEATTFTGGSGPSFVIVTGSTAQGQPIAQPFYVAVIC